MSRETRKKKDFNKVWDSLEKELREDLERLDHRLRTISNEAALEGVSREIIHEQLNRRFWQLAAEVAEGA